MLKPDGYKPRLADSQLEKLIEVFGCVQIDGPMWCGKTWTGLAHSKSVTSLDDDDALELAKADKKSALIGDTPHLIDEWQKLPPVRDAVRRQIDESGSKPGQFIMTGSSFVPFDEYSHSGAGRIAKMRMRPMSLFEQGLSDGKVSLSGLFDGIFEPANVDTSLSNVAAWICHGGWPASLSLDTEKALTVAHQYSTILFEESAPKKKLKAETTRLMLESLARNNATAASINTLAADIAREIEDEQIPSRITTKKYLDFFKDLFVIEELPAWDNAIRSKKRQRTKPKRYFVDPSLPAASMRLTPERLLKDGQLMGLLFENLCLRDLRIYADANSTIGEARLFYYSDEDNHEVDVIIELADGRWGAIEIKLGVNKQKEAVENLLWLKNAVMANPAAQSTEPSFLMLLTGNAPLAWQTPEGVYVVPISSLRD